MKRLFLTLALLVMLAILPAKARAAIEFDFSNNLNSVGFDNYEMILRVADGVTDGDEITLDGVLYDIIDETESVAIDDYFIQIYNADDLKINGVQVTGSGSPGSVTEFTGYAVQQISGFTVNGFDGGGFPDDVDIAFKVAALDPFGVFSGTDLLAGQMLRLFIDDLGGGDGGVDFTHQTSGGTHSANLIADVLSASDGIFWGSFGTGAPVDGAIGITSPGVFASNIDPTAVPTSDTFDEFGDAVAGLNILDRGAPISGIVFTGLPTGSLAGGGVHSLVGQSELFVNRIDAAGVFSSPADYFRFPSGIGGVPASNWVYASDDPFQFRGVPEPSSLLVFGGLFGVGAFLIRRKKLASKKS